MPTARKFYVIAHNPNTIDEAKAFLEAGANALEPDIKVGHGGFFVSHGGVGSNPLTAEHSLVTYLDALRRLINEEGDKINLAMIMWDFKDPDAFLNINDFLAIVHEHFGKFPECAGIAMSVTVSHRENIGFLTKYTGGFANIAVGIDEENDPTLVNTGFTAGNQQRYSYANGIITTGVKHAVFASMFAAKAVQADGTAMKLLYTWVIADSSTLRDFLRVGLDGIIVNIDTVKQLRDVLREGEFARNYELALKGYNPWSAPPLPTYFAAIHTADVSMAGTDAVMKFDLIGSNGNISVQINSAPQGVLEKGTSTTITFTGDNIGTVEAMTITEETGDISSQWLPKMIRVKSNIDSNQRFFNYDADDWLQKKVPLTKFAALAPAP